MRTAALSELYLHGCPIDGYNLKHLAGMKNLRLVMLTATKVSDEHLPRLYSATHLRVVNLDGSKCTLEGVADLRKHLPKCEITF